MRLLGHFRGSIKLVRTVSSDGRSARTRFRCIRPFTSRDPDRALTLVRGIGILELLGLFEDTTHSSRKSDPSPSRSVRSGRDVKPDGKPRSSSPVGAVKETELLLGEAVRGTSAPRLPSRQENSLLIGAGGSIQRLECQYGRECKFEHDKSPRNPAAPSTPRTGDRPVKDKPMYFGYCYDWMYGKCTAQQRKYLHQKPPPGTKPITPRTTAGPVVEDEEGDTPRSPVLPIGRQGVSTAPLKD